MLPPAALALGIALVAWAWWGAPTAAPEARRPAPVAAPPASLAPPSPPPLSPHAAPPAAAPAVSPLTALLAAPDAQLRASVHAALARRADGGRFYARALARRCAALAGLPAPQHPPDRNDARHQRATTRASALAAGCSQFATAEWLALVNIAPGEPADDPLLAAQQADLDDAALLQAVFTRPDALLLDELGERLLLRRIDGQPALYFDGQRFDGDSLATAQAALRLLPCHFGLVCDERDPEVWLACLRGDGCAGSRAEQEPAAAQLLATRLAAALRARELARFLPPS
jgi:hypothetical protein